MLLHGLTATRRYVVHGSQALPRRGFAIDLLRRPRPRRVRPGARRARATATTELAADLGAVLDERRRRAAACVLAGHSMGAHTLAAFALADPDRVAALVAIGPVGARAPADRGGARATGTLADGLERGGVDGFIEAYDQGLDPEWRETLLRITRERLALHRHPEAVAQALREVPRSTPVRRPRRARVPRPARRSSSPATTRPTRAIRTRSPRRGPSGCRGATLISEEPGESPLAWQGGRLSREIADVLRAARGRGAARAAERGAIREPVDEPQARPGLVDRADLVVDQAVRRAPSSRTTSSVMSVVDARGALRPGDPQAAGGVDRSAQGRRGGARARARRVKKATTTSSGPDRAALDARPRPGARRARRRELRRRAGEGDRGALLDPELVAAAACPSSRPSPSTYAFGRDRRRDSDPLRRGRAGHARLRAPTAPRSGRSTRSSTTTASTSSTGS